jgi:hypothetical protein
MVVVRRRHAPGCLAASRRVPAPDLNYWLEGRFGIRAVAPAAACIADAGRGPRVFLRCGLVAAPSSTGVAALVCTLAATESTAAVAAAEATLTTLTAGALGAVDLGIGVAQARADFIDFELDNGALLAFFCFLGTALQTAVNDNAHALCEGFRDVFGCFTPDRGAEEQGFPVLPLIRLAIEGAGRRSDGEIRYCRT